MTRRARAAVVATLGLVAACGAPATTALPSGTQQPTPSSSAGTAAIVGEWERVTRCEEIVHALREASMDDWVLEYAASFIPDGVVNDPDRPCIGAVPLRHSHFFTEEGDFGSRDQDGAQVDDGTYRILDAGTIVVPREFPERNESKEVTFRYSVEGDTMLLDPLLPACRPDCFAAVWAITVAYPGHAWTRVGAQPPDVDLEGTIVYTRAGGPYADETIFIANADGTGEASSRARASTAAQPSPPMARES
jgi:hypothetical protein